MEKQINKFQNLDPAILDVAARAAYEASCAVRGALVVDRDFKVQIVEWRAVAEAAATAAQALLPSMIASIDRAAGIPEGSSARLRTNAIVDQQVNAKIMADTLLRISQSGGSRGTTGDGHQGAIELSTRTLNLIANTPMGKAMDLTQRLAR